MAEPVHGPSYAELLARVKVLEEALAKVPHLAHDYDKDAFRFIGPMAADDSHDKKACATFGGRCAFAALASPSEPAGGRKDTE